MGNALMTAALVALGWLGDHWFQVAVLLFMIRVWIGLNFISTLFERLYGGLMNDDFAALIRSLKENRDVTGPAGTRSGAS